VVEEFILPFVLDHARPHLHGSALRTRAYLQFATEESKHIDLFRRFREEFEAGFGIPVSLIGPPERIARAVLAHHPLAVAIAILHIEWMSQRHYLDSVADDRALDPQFKSLLKHHWMEEAQHTKLDTLMLEELAEGRAGEEIDRAVDEYLAIDCLLDNGLAEQAGYVVDALTRATGRPFADDERAALVSAQHQAARWTYLGSGLTHPKFLATMDRLRPGARARLEAVAPAFS
jgi:hypothetical protein